MKPIRIAFMLATAWLALVMVSPVAHAEEKDLYPNSTREEPELDLRRQSTVDKLNKGLEAVRAGDAEKAKSMLQPLANESNSKYAKAMALQGLANLSYADGDLDLAIEQMKQSLDIGVMPNTTYFQLTYSLIQYYVMDEQYQKAAELLQKWRTEGKRETADSYALEGNILYRLGKYQEAIAAVKKAKAMNAEAGKTSPSSWDQILAASYAETGSTDEAIVVAKKRLAANPDDTTTLNNTVSLLVRAERYPEAVELLESARASGNITEAGDYIKMAKLYLMIAQSADDPTASSKKAGSVIEEGLSNGTLKPGFETYKLQGDAAFLGDDLDSALAYYKKAEPFAEDGAIQVRRGRILSNMGKNAEALKAIKSGLEKGVEDKGKAYLLLGATHANAGQRSAAISAMRKAAQYPETKDRAERWLKEVGAQ